MSPDGITIMEKQKAISELSSVYERAKSQLEFIDMFNARDEVIQRYQRVFSLNNLPNLTKEEFLSFLQFENNQHWTHLYRQQRMITADMNALREALVYLVDEGIPIEERLNRLRPPGGNPWIKGLSKAIITPILLIMNPDKYGVWNGTSEGSMRTLKIMPYLKRGSSFSEKYRIINELLLELASELKVDLWILDALWWGVKGMDETGQESPLIQGTEVKQQLDDHFPSFGLERYLQEFIFDNWEHINQFNNWMLYEVEDEIVGFEYNTGQVGRIDLLAKHKTEPKRLVIELKRDQASDETMGQVQRYMGWVQTNLAEKDEVIEGLIIAQSIDQRLEYALKVPTNIKSLLYEVNFTLRKPDTK